MAASATSLEKITEKLRASMNNEERRYFDVEQAVNSSRKTIAASSQTEELGFFHDKLDDVIRNMDKATTLQLQLARDRVAAMRESARVTLHGDSLSALEKQIDSVDSYIKREVNQRNSLSTRISGFFSKNKTNIASLGVGLLTNSPVLAAAVKVLGDKRRAARANAKGEQNTDLRELYEHLKARSVDTTEMLGTDANPFDPKEPLSASPNAGKVVPVDAADKNAPALDVDLDEIKNAQAARWKQHRAEQGVDERRPVAVTADHPLTIAASGADPIPVRIVGGLPPTQLASNPIGTGSAYEEYIKAFVEPAEQRMAALAAAKKADNAAGQYGENATHQNALFFEAMMERKRQLEDEKRRNRVVKVPYGSKEEELFFTDPEIMPTEEPFHEPRVSLVPHHEQQAQQNGAQTEGKVVQLLSVSVGILAAIHQDMNKRFADLQSRGDTQLDEDREKTLEGETRDERLIRTLENIDKHLGSQQAHNVDSGSSDTHGKGIVSRLLGGGLIPGAAKAATSAVGRAGSALASPMAALAGGLIWATVDGIVGAFKSGEWGVSKLSGFLGGAFAGSADNKVVNAFQNAGKWALIGAGIGSAVPVVGTLAGGIIGSIIGGILGIFGGQKVAKMFDGMGKWIADTFKTLEMSMKGWLVALADKIPGAGNRARALLGMPSKEEEAKAAYAAMKKDEENLISNNGQYDHRNWQSPITIVSGDDANKTPDAANTSPLVQSDDGGAGYDLPMRNNAIDYSLFSPSVEMQKRGGFRRIAGAVGNGLAAAGKAVVKAAEFPVKPLINRAKGTADLDDKQIDQFAEEIAHFEGFYMKEAEARAQHKVWPTRAQRNNNPGNIRTWPGVETVDGYAKFPTPEAGFKALKTQIRRNLKRGLTMQEFFAGKKDENGKVIYGGYAPESDKNDPHNYAFTVARNMNIAPDAVLREAPQSATQSGFGDYVSPITITPTGGEVLNKKSMDVMVGASASRPANTVIAPTTQVNNTSNTTYAANVKPRNNDSTYQRNQDRGYSGV